MGWQGHTTRRQRHLYLQGLYLRRARTAYERNARWKQRDENGHTRKSGLKWVHVVGLPYKLPYKYSGTFVASPFVPLGLGLGPSLVAPVGPRRPPHVKYNVPRPWLNLPGKWKHPARAEIGYHRRTVKTRRKRRRDARNTRYNRRITGCNFFFFRHGYYPDGDVAHRRPQLADVDPLNPPEPGTWPDPLGYVPVE